MYGFLCSLYPPSITKENASGWTYHMEPTVTVGSHSETGWKPL